MSNSAMEKFYALSDAERSERKRLFEAQVNLVDGNLRANASDFDKAILTYSSSALGLSVAIADKILQQANAHHWLLYGAWSLFALAILIIVGSYKVSSMAQRAHIKTSYRYYILCEDEALTETSAAAKWHERLTWSAALSFAFGVIFFAAFSISNFSGKTHMTDQKGLPQGDLQRGAPPPLRAPIIAPVPPSPSSQPAQSDSPSDTGSSQGE